MTAVNRLNDVIVLTGTFTNAAGAATDPTALTLAISSPTSVATAYTWPLPLTITRTSVGLFTVTVPGNEVGVWSYVWSATGAVVDVQSGTFDVIGVDPQPTLYATLDELNAIIYSGGLSSNTDDDAIKLMHLEGASRWIDEYCVRPAGFGRAAADTSRTYAPHDLYYCDIDDIASVTSIATDNDADGTFETTWAASDYQLKPVNPVRYGVTWPYNQVHAVKTHMFPWTYYGPTYTNTVQVTGRFGWPAVPAGVRNACLLLADAAYERRKSPSGVLGGFPDLAAVRVGKLLDPDVERWLAPYVSARAMVG